jgi:hypothetical protein
MSVRRFWTAGLVGGSVLSTVASRKFVFAYWFGKTPRPNMTGFVPFIATIFGMGFACGTVAWAARGLARRYGPVGDAIAGALVMLVYFSSCLVLFAKELLTEQRWHQAALMLALGVAAGLIFGAWIGRDLRRAAADARAQLARKDEER